MEHVYDNEEEEELATVELELQKRAAELWKQSADEELRRQKEDAMSLMTLHHESPSQAERIQKASLGSPGDDESDEDESRNGLAKLRAKEGKGSMTTAEEDEALEKHLAALRARADRPIETKSLPSHYFPGSPHTPVLEPRRTNGDFKPRSRDPGEQPRRRLPTDFRTRPKPPAAERFGVMQRQTLRPGKSGRPNGAARLKPLHQSEEAGEMDER